MASRSIRRTSRRCSSSWNGIMRMNAAPYDLWYWAEIPGRAEFIRLSLEAAKIPYRDRAREEGSEALVRDMASRSGPWPFAPPYLVAGDLCIAQIAHILLFLADRHGLCPPDEASRHFAHQLELTIVDATEEAHDVHHPVSGGLYYEEQRDEALRAAEGISHRADAQIPRLFRGRAGSTAADGCSARMVPRRSFAVPAGRGLQLRLSRAHGHARPEIQAGHGASRSGPCAVPSWPTISPATAASRSTRTESSVTIRSSMRHERGPLPADPAAHHPRSRRLPGPSRRCPTSADDDRPVHLLRPDGAGAAGAPATASTSARIRTSTSPP